MTVAGPSDTMITMRDGVRLHVEEVGAGTPIIFIHEYAGDWRTWEPQMRFFSRAHRCVTYSQRGYPPSDVPSEPEKYSQDLTRDDVITLMDALKIEKAHIVGHSMGALTALLVGIKVPGRCLSVTAAGCGYGSSPDPDVVAKTREVSHETSKMFDTLPFAEAAARYADSPSRQTHKYKDPRGFAAFSKMLAEHSPVGHALTMRHIQAKRPSLWEIEAELKKFTPPLLVLTGDEDDWCLEASLFIKRTVPTAGLAVIPRSGHTITSEEPAAFNAALADLIANADAGRWMSHRPPRP